MRLSEIRGERVFDVMADIADPLLAIALDDEAVAFFRSERCPEGEDPRHFVLERFRKSAPALLKGHKEDMMRIMAAINGVTVEEYADGLSMTSLLKDLYEMVTDEDLLVFLS